MKCGVCGTEIGVDEKVCHGCKSPVEQSRSAFGDAMTEAASSMAAGGSEPDEIGSGQEGTGEMPGSSMADGGVPETGNQAQGSALPEGAGKPPKSGKKTGIIIGVAAAAAVAVGALAFSFMGRKDPKHVVIDAFENICPDDQVKPLEELFGISQFAENAKTADVEDSISLILEDCSEAEVREWAGSGFRVSAQSDKTNKKNAADIAVIYKDMELANLEIYYGDETLMMAIPQLSSKVFTMDLGEGLEQRLQSSPLIGPALEDSEVDIEGILDYFQEQVEKAESGEAAFDLDSLRTRFREGTQAQEKFKEALVVEKGEKGTFTMDGGEVSCNGYKVLVSKDSMMEFLRTSADFFLNDQELKDQFIMQLEQSVKLAELMGGVSSGISADQIYADNIEDMKDSVSEMIDFLDKSLTDVDMTVYVDKKGRLAAVDGSTKLIDPDSEADEAEQDGINADFSFRLQGGAYLTQNMTADIVLENSGEHLEFSMVKNGTYDGKSLTGDLALDMSLDGEDKMKGGITCTGTYNSDGGDYHMGLGITADDSLLADISMSGVVDQLEKGTSIHADIDELKLTLMDAMAQISFNGEYSYNPLSSGITEPKGESFDVFAADEADLESIFMEVYMNVMQLMMQLEQ